MSILPIRRALKALGIGLAALLVSHNVQAEVYSYETKVDWEAAGWMIGFGFSDFQYRSQTKNIVKVDAKNDCKMEYRGYTDRSTANKYSKDRGDLLKTLYSRNTAATAKKSSNACICDDTRVDGLEVEATHILTAQEQANIKVSGGIEVTQGAVTGKLGVEVEIPKRSYQSKFYFTYLVCPTNGANSPPTATLISKTTETEGGTIYRDTTYKHRVKSSAGPTRVP